MLRWRFVDSTNLSAREREDMIELYRLYNDCDEDAARASFPSKGSVCLFSRPGNTRIEACFAQSESRVEVEGEPILLLELRYFYARRSVRGDASLLLAALGSMLRLWLRHPRARWYAVSNVCEPSYRWYANSMDQVWSLRHAQLPRRERQVLEHAARVLERPDARFDRERGGLRLGHGMKRPEQHAWDDEAGREFRRLLSDAHAGGTLLIIAELSLRNTLPALRRASRRLRSRGRSAIRRRERGVGARRASP